MTMLRLWRIVFLIFDPGLQYAKIFIMYIVVKLNKKKRKECTVTREYESKTGHSAYMALK